MFQPLLRTGRAGLVAIVFCAWSWPPGDSPAGQGSNDYAVDGEAAAEGQSATLAPVIVTAPRLLSALKQVPAGLTVVEKDDIQQGRPTVSLDEALTGVPGVFVQNRDNFAQDSRIAIRGFGARAAFGIRGIQLHADGLPLTLPDGQSQLDLIDPGAIERIEVMRGPVSALYGNGAGGVISITTEEGPDTPSVEARSLHGAFGLWKTQVKGGGQTERGNSFFSLSRLTTDGYRHHSGAESWTVNSKIRYDLNESSELTLLVNSVYSPELQDPGGLDRHQVAAGRRQAAPLSLQYDTGEEVADGRLGLVLRHALSSQQHLEAAGFYGKRQLDNAIPYRVIDLDRDLAGGRLQYDIEGELFGRTQQLFAGIDIQHAADDRLNYDNIGGNRGEELLLAQDEDVTNVGLFLQERLELTERWTVIVGGRYDNVRFAVDDRLLQDGDDTGAKTFAETTGRFGVTYAPARALQFYANIGQSFETPTSTELVNRPAGGGGINEEIKAQTAVNYEIGAKCGHGRFGCEAALFAMRLDDELIAFRDATDRVFYRNAGESRRTGAELSASLKLARGLVARLAYSYLDAEFTAYTKDGLDLAGKEVPGLPQHQLFGELAFRHPNGFYAGIDALVIGDFHVDDENSEKNGASNVANFRTGWEKAIGNWLVEPFFGVQNVFDETYNNNVRINARGGRYYEPAPGANVYAGLGLRYRL